MFEIVSPGTSEVDRFEKSAEYRDTPSILRYVVLEQYRAAATVFSRHDDDWVGHIVAGDATLDMPELGITLPLAELHLRMTFPEGAAAV